MRISRKAAGVVAAILTGLASLVAAGAAFASSTAPANHASSSSDTDHRVQVLRLRTVPVSVQINHAGNGGPANVDAIAFDVRTLRGAEAGKAYASCTHVTAKVTLCHVAFVLRGGQIEAQFANAMAPEFLGAVTGGTGIYVGVTGQIRTVVNPPVFDRTFYLIRPDRD